MLRLPRFRYLQPKSLSEAVLMMADAGPEAMYVAGGTDLYPNMKRRQQTPKVVIGLSHLEPLHMLRGEPQPGMLLGAGLTLTDVCTDRRVQASYPAVAKAAELIDLTQQKGEHPRMGAADVVPFVPVSRISLPQCVLLARQAGMEIWKRCGVPLRVTFMDSVSRCPRRGSALMSSRPIAAATFPTRPRRLSTRIIR